MRPSQEKFPRKRTWAAKLGWCDAAQQELERIRLENWSRLSRRKKFATHVGAGRRMMRSFNRASLEAVQHRGTGTMFTREK